MTKHDEAESLITPQEAAKIIGVSVRTLQGWRTDWGEYVPLPYYRLGRVIRYKREDIDNFLKRSRHE